jgi:hypothetical protein
MKGFALISGLWMPQRKYIPTLGRHDIRWNFLSGRHRYTDVLNDCKQRWISIFINDEFFARSEQQKPGHLVTLLSE